jgi:hypothetical protein
MKVDPFEESAYNNSPGNSNNNGRQQQPQQHWKMKSDDDFLARSETARLAYSSKFC